MSLPLYSIIIPLYNKERQIARTLDSVLAQSVTDFEVIVVDDGSKDRSSEIVKGYSDPRIRYIWKENGGVSSARNRGIQEAKGEWILFLDADDTLDKTALQIFDKLIAMYRRCTMFVGGVRTIQNNVDLTKVARKSNDCYQTRFPYFAQWLNKFYPRPGATLVHRTLIERYGGFDTRMSFYEDYEFGWRMMQCGRVAYTANPVVVYLQEDGGLSLSSHSEKKEMAYYIPAMKTHGFFSKALLFENLEFEINWWRDNPEVLSYYNNIKHKYFSPIHAILHWVRQKMLNHHWI